MTKFRDVASLLKEEAHENEPVHFLLVYFQRNMESTMNKNSINNTLTVVSLPPTLHDDLRKGVILLTLISVLLGLQLLLRVVTDLMNMVHDRHKVTHKNQKDSSRSKRVKKPKNRSDPERGHSSVSKSSKSKSVSQKGSLSKSIRKSRQSSSNEKSTSKRKQGSREDLQKSSPFKEQAASDRSFNCSSAQLPSRLLMLRTDGVVQGSQNKLLKKRKIPSKPTASSALSQTTVTSAASAAPVTSATTEPSTKIGAVHTCSTQNTVSQLSCGDPVRTCSTQNTVSRVCCGDRSSLNATEEITSAYRFLENEPSQTPSKTDHQSPLVKIVPPLLSPSCNVPALAVTPNKEEIKSEKNNQNK